MKKNLLKTILVLFAGIFISAVFVNGQRQMENLNRHVVAIRTGTSQVFVSWTMMGTEYTQGATYNLYRGTTLIASNLSTTNYADNTSSNSTYSVSAVIGGSEQARSATASVMTNNYLSVPISAPSSNHHANDCSVGDLDGDGDYEIVLKWEANDAKDNSQSGYTDVVYLDGIELNGTRMWRINLGINIRAGAHYTQFMVYDLDGDGKAEVACKTAPGTRSGTGSYLSIGPAASDNDAADYRNSSGYILTGPEYLTIFNGQTGAELVTTNYLPGRGTVSSWGDDYGNRVDRFLACIAYLDGSKPSLVMCRGYYTRSVLVAWDYRNGSLTQRWTFDSNNGYSAYAGQGNHNLSVADVDSDGKDEIIYGSCAINDNGAGLWNSGLGHGDALHVSDIVTNRSGLEVWGIHEGSTTPGSALLDARTGAVIWKTANADVGRGVSADLTSAAGMECWGGTSDLRTASNSSAGSNPASSNHLIWWDGDEYRELLNSNYITKYGGGTLLTASNCVANNGTKSNPCLTADILGDWREEAIWRTSDNTSLRIFMATATTNRRMYTLMHDPQYRLSIAWQNVAYNQPPHTGFFFGSGMSNPPNPNISLVGGSTCSPTAISPYVQVDGGTWQQAASVTVSAGATVKFGPQPVSGGSWRWTGPNNFSASVREVTISNVQTAQAGNYIATYTNSCGAETTQTFTISISGGGSSITLTIQENQTGFCSVDGTIDNNNAGFTGDGFANTNNASGAGITWSVSIPTTGTYSVAWRYANGGTTDRTAQIMVNGSVVVSNASFPGTGAWTTWTTTSGANVSLSAGTRLIRLQATNSGGLANIDYFTITGVNPTGVSCAGQKSTGFSFESSNKLEVYPNPLTGDELELLISLSEKSDVKVKIYNSTGKLITSDDLGVQEAGTINHPVNMSSFTSGIYVILMQYDGGYKTSTLIRK